MTKDAFEALVQKLEGHARRNPARYRTHVLLLALAGNAYLALMVLLMVALLVGLIASVTVLRAVAVKLALVVGVFLWMIVKALWVKVPPPDGLEITAEQAPELFALIKELRGALGAPRFHHVLLTDEFNAGVVQAPRLGAFGWYRNYLLVGLPLMKSLSVEQFKSVLAHEFGHLAKGHGRLSNWIYRQRLRWSRLMSALEENESWGTFLFKPFLKWYSPYFNAYSFPLARQNEYEADATAVRLTSGAAAAQALTGVHVVGSYLAERYWPGVHELADDSPQPSFAPYSSMGQSVAAELDAESTERWMQQAMAQETTFDDTHPALADRLAAIGREPDLAPPAPGEAADALLGDLLALVTDSFDRRWHDNVMTAWEQRHQQVKEGRARLAQLDAQVARDGEQELNDAIDRAVLTESIGGDADAALVQFRALYSRAPANAVVCYGLGIRLLARDDDSGCKLVERAMQYDDDATFDCCEALRDYCWRRGRKDEAHAWHDRLVERAQWQQAVEKERGEVRLDEKFERHGLSAAAVNALKQQLSNVPGLRKAYLVKKKVKYLPERPCYVFGYVARSRWGFAGKNKANAVLKEIQDRVEFPGETLIISVEGENYRFARKLQWMRGTRIF